MGRSNGNQQKRRRQKGQLQYQRDTDGGRNAMSAHHLHGDYADAGE
jgi:hypothetical protein